MKTNKNKKTVLVISALPINTNRGASIRILNQCKLLKKHGYAVDLITSNIKKVDKTIFSAINNLFSSGISVLEEFYGLIYEIKRIYLYVKFFIIWILRLFLSKKYSFVIIHSSHPFVTYFAVLLSKLLGYNVVFDAHDISSHSLYYQYLRTKNKLFLVLFRIVHFTEQFVYLICSKIFVVSERMKKIMCNEYVLLPKSKIFVYYNFPVISKYALFSKNELMSVKQTLGIRHNKYVILYLGRLERHIRGIELLLEAFKIIITKNVKNLHLLFVGDGEMKHDIIAFSKNNMLTDFITIIGEVDHKEIQKYIAISDFGIIPYQLSNPITQYAMPRKFFELLEAGLLLIIPEKTEMAEVCDYCIKFSSKNPYNLAKVFMKISEMPKSKLNSLRNKIRNMYFEKFEKKIIDEKVMKFILYK